MTCVQRCGLRIIVAHTRLQRLLGLHAVAPGARSVHALLLPRCRAIHTVGLAAAIDVVFLSADGRVLRIIARLRTNRAAFCTRAFAVLELPAGYCGAPGWSACVSLAWAAWKMEV